MNKKIIIAIILLVLGGLLVLQGIVVEEAKEQPAPRKWNPDNPWEGFQEKLDRNNDLSSRLASGQGSSDPDVPGTAIAGGILVIGGIIFLVKSKDEKFLPNI